MFCRANVNTNTHTYVVFVAKTMLLFALFKSFDYYVGFHACGWTGVIFKTCVLRKCVLGRLLCMFTTNIAVFVSYADEEQLLCFSTNYASL
jgi:hypothetical protein